MDCSTHWQTRCCRSRSDHCAPPVRGQPGASPGPCWSLSSDRRDYDCCIGHFGPSAVGACRIGEFVRPLRPRGSPHPDDRDGARPPSTDRCVRTLPHLRGRRPASITRCITAPVDGRGSTPPAWAPVVPAPRQDRRRDPPRLGPAHVAHRRSRDRHRHDYSQARTPAHRGTAESDRSRSGSRSDASTSPMAHPSNGRRPRDQPDRIGGPSARRSAVARGCCAAASGDPRSLTCDLPEGRCLLASAFANERLGNHNQSAAALPAGPPVPTTCRIGSRSPS